jgi:hypothetical protein
MKSNNDVLPRLVPVDSLWTIKDVQKYLNTSLRNVERLRSTGQLVSAIKVDGRSVRFVPAEVIAWAMSRKESN